MRKQIILKFTSIATVIILTVSYTFAQNDYISALKGKNMIFKTNDTNRIIINAGGNVEVKGKLTVDSLHVFGGAKFGNSININVIPNEIYTDNSSPFDLFIQSNPSFSHNTILNRYSGNVGIGTTTPNNTIQVKDLINFDNPLWNTYLGYQAGNLNAGGENTFLGYQAGHYTNGGYGNTANGTNALYSNTIGVGNNAIGRQALYSNTSGDLNTANGANVLYYNTTGSRNTATGWVSMNLNIGGSYNTANGMFSLYSNISGNYNTALGYNADVASSGLILPL